VADSLLIVGSALATSGGGLVTTAGGAPCCCGQGGCVPPNTPCARPPCLPRLGIHRLRRFSGPSGENVVIEYDFQAPACCGPAENWTGSYLFSRRTTTYAQIGGVWRAYSCESLRVEGAGGIGHSSSSLSWAIPVTFTRRDCFTGRVEVSRGTVPFTACTVGAGVGLPLAPFVGTYLEGFERWQGGAYEGQQSYMSSQLPGGSPNPYGADYLRVVLHPGRVPECATGWPLGACCCRGRCFDQMSAAACGQMGGGWLGPGTRCESPSCATLRGACCLPDGVGCRVSTEEQCTRVHGYFHGPLTTCERVICAGPTTAACCLPNATCEHLTRQACEARQGEWRKGLTCQDPNVCGAPDRHPCCYTGPNGVECELTTLEECNARQGEYHPESVDCELVNCTGACCHRQQHGWQCSQELQSQCAILNQGTFYGYGSVCEGVPCPPDPGRLFVPPARSSQIVVPGRGCSTCGGGGTGGLTL